MKIIGQLKVVKDTSDPEFRNAENPFRPKPYDYSVREIDLVLLEEDITRLLSIGKRLNKKPGSVVSAALKVHQEDLKPH